MGVIGGGDGMAGAALLAGIAALQTGCGKVFIGFNQATPPSAAYAYHPELMLDSAARTVQRDNISTWVVGCGLGQNESAARALHAIWNSNHPQLVLERGRAAFAGEPSQIVPARATHRFSAHAPPR